MYHRGPDADRRGSVVGPGQTGEQDCSRLRTILRRGERAGEKNLDSTMIVKS